LSNIALSDERAIPEELEPHGYGVFEWAWAPNVPYTQTAEPAGVTRHNDGIFRPTFNVRSATENEIKERTTQASQEARHKRNRHLTNSDITQLPQATEQMKAKVVEWEAYRQELRDISEQAGFPFDVQWPTKPEEDVI